MRAAGCPPRVLRAYQSFMGDLRHVNSLGPGLGTPHERACGIPQGCPLSMTLIALLMRPWIMLMRECGAEPRVLADDVFDVIEGVEAIAADKGVPVSEFSLAWVAAQPGVTAPIIGPRTLEHLEGYLRALSVEITAEDEARVDALVAPGRAVTNYYEGDYGPHPR